MRVCESPCPARTRAHLPAPATVFPANGLILIDHILRDGSLLRDKPQRPSSDASHRPLSDASQHAECPVVRSEDSTPSAFGCCAGARKEPDVTAGSCAYSPYMALFDSVADISHSAAANVEGRDDEKAAPLAPTTPDKQYSKQSSRPATHSGNAVSGRKQPYGAAHLR